MNQAQDKPAAEAVRSYLDMRARGVFNYAFSASTELPVGEFIPAGGMVVIGADGLARPCGGFSVAHYCGTDWSYEAAVFFGRQLVPGESYAFRRRMFWERFWR